ncbi:MAG: hypothetical protein RLZZ511_4355 [Cyanobacteriota bacterium]|jgi:hypothetical protein
MSRHWAILIGVNQYQHRQPLLCAHADAQAMYRLLTQEAGITPQTCVLLSDRAPKLGENSTYPIASTLRTWLGAIPQAGIQAEDTLWVFFSGYGECWEGQDYLLPLDAASEYDPATWLSLQSLYGLLGQLPTKNVLLLLDINRSQSARSGSALGRQVMQHAKSYGVATILSCQPEQFSHESAALDHGFFTVALLEGLRQCGGQPLMKLARFLQARLPELSDHNNRPRQDPIIMVAPTQLEQWRLPAIQPIAVSAAPKLPQPTVNQAPTAVQPPTTALQSPSPSPQPESQPTVERNAVAEPSSRSRSRLTRLEVLPVGSTAAPAEKATNPLSGTIAPAIHAPIDSSEPGITLERVSQNPPSVQSRRAQSRERDEVNVRSTLLKILALGALLMAVLGLANALSRSQRSTPSLFEAIGQKSPSGSSAITPATPMPTAPSPDPSARLNVPQSPPADSAKILEEARAAIRPVNASEVQRAIERASQIPPGDGRYDETQRQIDRWCNDILAIAKQRAERGNYKAAIEAAQLIPDKRGKISQETQTLIQQWQKASRKSK